MGDMRAGEGPGLQPAPRDSAAADRLAPPAHGARDDRPLTVRSVFFAVLLVAAAGLLAAWATPRGPLSAAQVLWSMLGALGVGMLAGALLRSRWSMLVTPVTFLIVFELARLGTTGATVEEIRLDSIIGALGFVSGRGVHGLLVLVPMVLGCRLGVEVAARRRSESAARMTKWGWAGVLLVGVAVLALAALIARPASTAPILDTDGDPAAGSIAELVTISVGGSEQTLMIRGASAENPLLLHLAGGPGGTDLGAMRLDPSLEEDFLVATWDQPGTGKSYSAIDPVQDMTLQRVTQDTLEVTEYLRDRFNQDRIVLTGQSWGTLPGVLAVQQHPERYRAFVGTGQMVDIRETDQIFYDESLEWAGVTGDQELQSQLEAQGPPPYSDMLDYTAIVGTERAIYAYPEFDGSTEMTATIWVPENTFMDRVNAIRGLLDTYSLLYPQLQDLDLRQEAPRLEVPIYVVMGEHEARGRVGPAREWFDQLEAPEKTWVEFPASSHRASFERPEDYAALLRQVLAETDTEG
ncbi:peptidase [Nesterenkonia sp. AN1]|uniref:Pimeloyl-ACP methyl ester carboxylesterase n=1 Tax=Nesterenkonia aurantiaca TaxID=1436010 RepID=A0A4R7G2C6_9MICC|nr:alpha/beta hydrolase [Nesterenkonia sp. AN1]EXF26124.1 peptidase [Nesterenkonia sp. AN1]TDS85473.1 pimeloyl-ACP methyl ester carboxylesterase [Nesterenkonia aurantiaca]